MPGAPDVGWPHYDPFAVQVGAPRFLFGDDLALSVDCGGEIVLVMRG